MRDEEVILVVEDERDLVAIFERTLEHAGFRVLTAHSGEQALSVLQEHGGRVDLVISDVVMPGMGGRELVWRLQSLYPGMPTVLLSGYADPDSALEMIDGTGTIFLEKPVELPELTRIVRSLLDERARR